MRLGNGYMMEAVIEVMRFLFNQGYSNVICGYNEGNKKSKRLQEKMGFEYYKTIKNAWQKNGASIDTHELIMSRERFEELYNIKLR